MQYAHALAALALAAAVISTTAPAAAQQARTRPAAASTPEIRFEKLVLANGMEIILAEDHRLPLVAFNLWVHAGPRNEAAGQTGFAHLFEHLMFAGSKHIARGQADRIVDGAGGTDANGTTNFDRTNYFFTLPSNQLELGLWIKSDMLGYMIDQVDANALAVQQDVVRNERRQNIENRPYGVPEEVLYEALFPAGHPYRAAIMGSHADIQSIKLPDVHRFARAYYRPNNATLVLAGDFDAWRAKALVQRYFGSLKAGPKVPAVAIQPPRIEAERRIIVKDRVELPKLSLAWHTPATFQPGDAELDMAATVLGGGKASRLYKKLVYERQLAQSVDVLQSSMSLSSVFSVEVVVRPGHTTDEVEAVVDAELDRLAKSAPTAAEMQQALVSIETRMFQRLERLGTRADQLNFYNQVAGDPGYLARDLARYRQATPEAVRAAVAALLGKSQRVNVVTLPGEPVLAPEVPTPPAPAAGAGGPRESINADEPWRAQQPAPGPAPRLALPTGKPFRLANGLTVIHVAQRNVPLVSATLVLRAGQDRDAPARAGVASFTADMLERGTQKRSAQQLADTVADLGASLATEFAREDLRLRVSSLASRFPAALELVADLALNPAFAEDEIARQKQAAQDLLLRQRESIANTADVVARAAMYGPQHPLGRSIRGDEAAIQATTRAELQAFWRKHYRPERAALVVSGDIDEPTLRRLAQRLFGAWRSSGAAAPADASAALKPQPTKARLVLVDKPGATQTAIHVVGPGPRADAADAAAALVMNNALGGLFTSRINQQLREVKGYSYGVFSGFALGRSHTLWSARGSVRGDVTGAALQDLLAQVQGMQAAPLPADELGRARNAALLSLPGEFDANDAVTQRLAAAWTLGQPADHYRRWPEALAGVDANSALAAAKQHVQPAQLTVIAVGDLAQVRPQLEALGLGAAELRDPDGRLVHQP